mmetsp:Transcript_6302/g.15681  ORF Transcript_6302/g.15681 Transcript_6302/m.15681 type:complete len:126 (-) Transcript_6302:262-639(-)
MAGKKSRRRNKQASKKGTKRTSTSGSAVNINGGGGNVSQRSPNATCVPDTSGFGPVPPPASIANDDIVAVAEISPTSVTNANNERSFDKFATDHFDHRSDLLGELGLSKDEGFCWHGKCGYEGYH